MVRIALSLTPSTRTGSLNRRSRIFLKLENLQPSGSFKSRGIGNYLVAATKRANDPERVHFYSSSGGNAGLACVHAANFLGRPSTVVVPTSTKPMMIRMIKTAGATEVIQQGASWKEADAYLREVVIADAEANGFEGVYVPPFDHPDIWEGHSTLIDELRQQFGELGEAPPDLIACSVGGGGLFCGIMQGLEKLSGQWSQTNVLAVETEGAASLGKSLQANELISLPAITSQATTLGARQVAGRAFELATKHRETGRFENAILSDAEAALGCWRLADDERILVELACGVTTALAYGGRLEKALGRPVQQDEKVVLVVCGGSTVTTAMIQMWRSEFGNPDGVKSGA